MARSLFLFDMTFWLYLASLTLYVAYLFARRPAMAFAYGSSRTLWELKRCPFAGSYGP